MVKKARLKRYLGFRRIFLCLVGILVLFCNPFEEGKADRQQKIHSIDVSAVLEEDGTATITEDWEVTAQKGTELYKPLRLEKEQSLLSYQVEMDGQAFQETKNWKVKGNFQEKAYRYGRNENKELNWGISQYGRHRYRLIYRVSNFVMQTKTKQMIYWRFIPDQMSAPPRSIQIRIRSTKGPLDSKNNRVWAFGFQGEVHFVEGQVVAKSSKALTKENSGIILLGLPEGTFKTTWMSDKTFDDYVKEAFRGSQYNYEDYDATKAASDIRKLPRKKLPKRLKYGILVGGICLLVVAVGKIWQSIKVKQAIQKWYPKFSQLQKKYKGQYERQLPTKDIFSVYCLLEAMSVKKLEANCFTAMILSLVHQGALTLVAKEGTLKKQFIFQVNLNFEMDPEDVRYPLWQVFSQASDQEGRLTDKAFKAYCEEDDEGRSVMSKIKSYSLKQCKEAGWMNKHLYVSECPSDLDLANRNVLDPLTEEGMQARDLWVKFANYLTDFSLLNERGAAEVAIWDQLLIGAAFLGIAKEVEAEFAKVYPKFRELSVYQTSEISFEDYYVMSYIMWQDYYIATQPTFTSAMSGGGGGFSSFGGGSGAFGGGSGGGFR